MEERWKDIVGFENTYQVSNLGTVKSLKRKSWNGKTWHIIQERYLKQTKASHKYFTVSLSKNGQKKSFLVHNLVASAFIDNPENKKTVNHIDGNKTNNQIENLEWATQSENNYHAYQTGLAKSSPVYGEKHWGCKLTDYQVLLIRKQRKENNHSLRTLARQFNVSHQTISRIISNKTRIII